MTADANRANAPRLTQSTVFDALPDESDDLTAGAFDMPAVELDGGSPEVIEAAEAKHNGAAASAAEAFEPPGATKTEEAPEETSEAAKPEASKPEEASGGRKSDETSDRSKSEALAKLVQGDHSDFVELCKTDVGFPFEPEAFAIIKQMTVGAPADWQRLRAELKDKTKVRLPDLDAALRAGSGSGDGSAKPNHHEFVLTPHEHPVADIGPVLDAIVAVLKKVLAAPATHFDAEALWAAHTHLLQRRELGIRHTPRLAFQSEFEDSGKTTAMETLLYVAARSMATSSLSGASLYRETDVHHWTVLWDEADNAFHKNANPELIGVFNAGWSRKFSFVHRQAPLANGGYEQQVFDTFTGIALTAIHVFKEKSMQSRCIVLGMQRATKDDAARLQDFDEGHEEALTVCGRKLVRWGADLDALPPVDKTRFGLINRIWLNWRSLLQIADLAGGTWPARALAAARADMARVRRERDDSLEYALLAAIWRVLTADDSTPRRMHTKDLINKLHQEDEGRWFTAGHGGKPIDEYYLRNKLKRLLPADGDYAKPSSRRWRPDKKPKKNPLNGYHELHFADAFERYLGKGLPSAEPPASHTEEEGK